MWLLLTIVLINGVPDFEVLAKTTTMTECIQLMKKQPKDPNMHCIYAKSVDK
jgi:hypothetical protein